MAPFPWPTKNKPSATPKAKSARRTSLKRWVSAHVGALRSRLSIVRQAEATCRAPVENHENMIGDSGDDEEGEGKKNVSSMAEPQVPICPRDHSSHVLNKLPQSTKIRRVSVTRGPIVRRVCLDKTRKSRLPLRLWLPAKSPPTSTRPLRTRTYHPSPQTKPHSKTLQITCLSSTARAVRAFASFLPTATLHPSPSHFRRTSPPAPCPRTGSRRSRRARSKSRPRLRRCAGTHP